MLEYALKKKRTRSMIQIGSSSEPYIPLEEELQLVRRCLNQIERFDFGLVLHTHSMLALRDIDILDKINRKTKCIVIVRLSTYDDSLAKKLEPGTSLPSERFSLMQQLTERGITAYWDQRANEDLMIRNKMYYTTGDISLVDNMSTNAILFNKGMRAAYGLDDPYELVRSGDWTLEKFIELARAVGEDANQDGIYDENDVFGLMTWNDATLAVLAAAGEKICSIDKNGDLELTFYNERVVNLFDTFAGLYFDYAHTFNYQYDTQAGEARPSAEWDTNRTKMFDSDQVLFYFTTLITVPRHRDSETDFGILPFPKFDKSQERYGHVISDYAGQYICVPEMTGDFARAGLVLEEMAYQGQKVLTPAYYDQTLIGQYMRDEESTEMLDIIFSSRVYDVGMYYKIGNYRDSLISYSRTHASLSSIYDTSLNAANKKIDTINLFFNQLNTAD